MTKIRILILAIGRDTHQSLRAGEILHDFKLDLLKFGQALPLPVNQMVELLVQVPDFEFGLENDPVVILGSEPVLCLLPLLAHHDNRGLNARRGRRAPS